VKTIVRPLGVKLIRPVPDTVVSASPLPSLSLSQMRFFDLVIVQNWLAEHPELIGQE
jgi:hypothetical protein